MSIWKVSLTVLVLIALVFLYLDDKRYEEEVRPSGFSTDAPVGSVFAIRLCERLDLRRVRAGQTICFMPVESKPYGSVSDALLPAEAVLEASVRQILSGSRGRRVVIFRFERLRVGRRAVPLSAFLTVKRAAQVEMEETRRELRGSIGAFVARSVQDDPLIVLSGYLSGTYFGSFWSRQIEAPASFFSNESGQSIPTSMEFRVQLHRRTFVPR